MPRPAPKCGTNGGYSRHIRGKEQVCDPCRLARRQYLINYEAGVRLRKPAKRNCANCLQSFTPPRQGEKGWSSKYCDDYCRRKAIKNKRSVGRCRQCGRIYQVNSVKDHQRGYCTSDCYFESRKGRRKTDRLNLVGRCRGKGIKPIQYEFFVKLQGDKCCICGSPEFAQGQYRGIKTGRRRALSIDHCHETSQFRGLLCNTCNTALGMVQDNPFIVENLLAYLNHHEMRLKPNSRTYMLGSGMLINVQAALAAHAAGADPVELQNDPTIIHYL